MEKPVRRRRSPATVSAPRAAEWAREGGSQVASPHAMSSPLERKGTASPWLTVFVS
jgi:hypothetical protein